MNDIDAVLSIIALVFSIVWGSKAWKVLAFLALSYSAFGQPTTFTYTFTDRTSTSRTITLVGTNPNGTPHVTNITTRLIPVQVGIADSFIPNGQITLDPLTADSGCITSGITPMVSVYNSHIFNAFAGAPNQYTSQDQLFMNGQNMGTVTWPTAVMKQSYWNRGANAAGYAVNLVASYTPPTFETPLQISLPFFTSPSFADASGPVPPDFGFCGNLTGITNTKGYIGVFDISAMDTPIQAYLGAVGFATTDLPIFISYNVGLSYGNACCVLGYHGVYNSNQPYIWATYMGRNGFFGTSAGQRDVYSLSHEVAEFLQDPYGNNPTPIWGNIGQAQTCSGTTFEVGDPLSQTSVGTHVATDSLGNNTYHYQQVASFDWFYGPASTGKNGLGYSTNGSFIGPANACPPGGSSTFAPPETSSHPTTPLTYHWFTAPH